MVLPAFWLLNTELCGFKFCQLVGKALWHPWKLSYFGVLLNTLKCRSMSEMLAASQPEKLFSTTESSTVLIPLSRKFTISHAAAPAWEIVKIPIPEFISDKTVCHTVQKPV